MYQNIRRIKVSCIILLLIISIWSKWLSHFVALQVLVTFFPSDCYLYTFFIALILWPPTLIPAKITRTMKNHHEKSFLVNNLTFFFQQDTETYQFSITPMIINYINIGLEKLLWVWWNGNLFFFKMMMSWFDKLLISTLIHIQWENWQ